MAYQPKSYRKYLAGAAATAVLAAGAPAAFAAGFTDSIPAWAQDAVDYLVEKGAIQGYPDGTYGQAKEITRAEAAKIIAISLDLEIDEDAKTDFADAKNHWSSAYIAALQAQKEGVINGYEDGSFKPNNKISRQEMAKMVVTAYGLELDETKASSFSDNNGWGKEYVSILASLGVVEGVATGKFDPNGDVTRGQTPVFIHRAEVEEVRVPVKDKDAGPSSVKLINDTKLEVTFGKAISEDLAVEIEKDGDRFVVYDGGQTANSEGVIKSQTISFNADRTKASIILQTEGYDDEPTERKLKTDISYIVALMDGQDNTVATMVEKFGPTVLKESAAQPEVTVDATQDKLILKFNEKMSDEALTVGHYTIFENNNALGEDGELVDFVVADKNGNYGKWVDSTEKKAVEFKLNVDAETKLLAGKTYRVKVDAAVETDKGDVLAESKRIITVKTPSVSEAQPEARFARVVGDTIIVTFDQDLAIPNFNSNQVVVKKPSGQTISVSSVERNNLEEATKELKITLPAESLDPDLTYTVELPANGVANAYYPNASNKAVTSLKAQAQADIEVTSVSAKFINQNDDKAAADLLLTFNQRPNVDFLTSDAAGKDIVIKDGGDTYELTGAAEFELYHGDTSGKTVIVKNVNTSFDHSTKDEGFVPKSGKSYTIEVGVNVVKTDNGTKLNQEKLKAETAGLSIAGPVLDKIRLESAEKIVLEFKEDIDVSSLKASDIDVKGFEKYRNGNFAAATLSGDSQIKFSASGKILTITPANSDVKFETSDVDALVVIAEETLKGKNSGVENDDALNTTSLADDKVIDRAAPVIIGATHVDENEITVTYSEPVQFKGSEAAKQASQFVVENASKAAYGIAEDFALIDSGRTLEITFNEDQTFKSDLDLSKVKVVYTKNSNVFVKDVKGNEASSQTITGLKR